MDWKAIRGSHMNKVDSILTDKQLHSIHPFSRQDLQTSLQSGNSTGVAVIACSEVDVCADLPGDPDLPIYIWQNFGACVVDSGGLEDIILQKSVSDIVLYGHCPCNIIELALRSDDAGITENSGIQHILDIAKETRSVIKKERGDRFDKETFRKASEDFVLRQAAALFKIASIRDAIEENKIRIHVWLRLPDDETLLNFDSQKRTFCSCS